MNCKEAFERLVTDIKDAYMNCYNGCDLKDGDTVKIVRHFDTNELGCGLIWNPEMNNTIGRTGKIKKAIFNGYSVGFNEGRDYTYPFFVLEKIEEPKAKLKPGQLVLVRKMHCTDNGTKFIWCIDVFSHVIDIMDKKRCVTTSSTYDESNCIPYEGNEHLLGKEVK